MLTLYRVYYEIHDEVSKNDKVHNSFIKYKNCTVCTEVSSFVGDPVLKYSELINNREN